MEFFWHEACLAHDTGDGLWELPGRWEWLDEPEPHPENAARLRTFRHALTHGPVATHLTWSAGRFATDEELARVHTAAYLAHIYKACTAGERVSLETNTVVGPGSWDAIRAAAGTALAACEAVRAGRTRLAYALVRPPGHHAQRALADGYCMVNNAALVAETARRAGHRVAVLDWDVHHGNGTQDVFRDSEDVLTVSIHMRHGPWGAHHTQTGGPEESDRANLNVELSLGAGDTAYRRALDELAVPAIRAHGTDFLVCASGFDGSAFDPNGRHNLTAAGYRDIGRRVAALDLPTVLTQEGGYLRGYSALCLHALVEGLVGTAPLLDDPLAYVPDDTRLVDSDLARAATGRAGRGRA
ncbi:acetoin utilization deacetylase AcuC-like enzyme [Saccharothrix tamanrassetensis]|uniref:Acetoin utilization deacetylase AcuC-like enzyme n=1 Tax=Saccharothrix tamanrassetensis TaxID=1051531 RepID=A0A841CD90_9PSEU|nr:histone deacetylase [Saccharothrix tamanrassetensis]MBB5954950.1 acetoin utilization deacetylase AcuC-like enzyme [Saccharothrix tamanrassetensis]